MSWIFAVAGPERRRPPLPMLLKLHGEALYVYSSPTLYIACGGIPETCLHEVCEERGEGWMMAGMGIEGAGNGAKVRTREDWSRLLASGDDRQDSVDGHFVAMRWNHAGLECRVDQLGLRTAYYGCARGTVCITTRLDWAARMLGMHEIDFTALEGRWMLFNQLGSESGVRGIGRLGPGGCVHVERPGVVREQSTPWLPEFGTGDIEPAVHRLEELLCGALQGAHRLSLGLSGGVDSRFLLAMLHAAGPGRFDVHTFGCTGDPDVEISVRLARELGVERRWFNGDLPCADALYAAATTFASQTCLVEPVSALSRLQYYGHLREQGVMLIDGGFGGIARRQYMKRVARLGRAALGTRNYERLAGLLCVHRADVFTRDAARQIFRGCIAGLERTLDAMPSMEKIGLENYVDLLTVRTRLPNYGAPEQARLDGVIPNIMPLAQPSFLRAVFASSLEPRRNGRLYRALIRRHAPVLARFPFAACGTTYPFRSTATEAWLWTKAKTRMGMMFVDPARSHVLDLLKPHILDLAHSKDVVEWHAYDAAKIRAMVTGYYGGNRNLGGAVDWWLTFELWRRALVMK